MAKTVDVDLAGIQRLSTGITPPGGGALRADRAFFHRGFQRTVKFCMQLARHHSWRFANNPSSLGKRYPAAAGRTDHVQYATTGGDQLIQQTGERPAGEYAVG